MCVVRRIGFTLDGEGRFCSVARLFQSDYAYTGESLTVRSAATRSDLSGFEIGTRNPLFPSEKNTDFYWDHDFYADGLEMLRPVAMEKQCAALRELPLFGPAISMLIDTRGLVDEHGESCSVLDKGRMTAPRKRKAAST